MDDGSQPAALFTAGMRAVTPQRRVARISLFVCNLVFIIPLHAARRAMAAVVGFSKIRFSSTVNRCRLKQGLLHTEMH